MNLPSLADDLNAFAGRISAFRPHSTSLDRDALMFAAGQASQEGAVVSLGNDPEKQIHAWQRATAAMTFVATCLALALVLRPVPEPRVIIVERERPAMVAEPGRSVSQSQRDSMNAVAPDAGSGPYPPASPSDDDRHLAEAWNARREMLAQGDRYDDRLAAVPSDTPVSISGDDGLAMPRRSRTYPVTNDERSHKTIQRLLEEQL